MNPHQLRLEAEQLLQRRQHLAALQRFEDLVALEPQRSGNWLAYGQALVAADRPLDAVSPLERASVLAPDDVSCRTLLGSIFKNHSQLEEAIRWHGEALARAPDSLVLRLNHACLFPVVAASTQQISSCRERCFAAFERLQNDAQVRLDPSHSPMHHTFALTYHGRNDRAWLEAYARLVMRHVNDDAQPPLCHPPQGRPRLRLGFASSHFDDHSNSLAIEGLLQAIDRDRFELVLIHLPGSRDDAVRRRLEATVDRVVQVPVALPQARSLLLAQELDLLYYTDVGINPSLPALLCGRYAPVQVTGWGFPRTSGFPTLDFYLSGDLVEPPHGQEHYSETLIRLSGLPCRYLACNLESDAVAQAMGRAYFLLPEDLPLVGCLQSFWKLHPDFDQVLERIALAVPDALFVFVDPRPHALADVFLERLRRQAPAAAERLVLVAQVPRSQFGVLAGCMDVLLDTLHFGSGITFYETAASGTPTVCMEGPMLCSRFVAAGYRLMGLADAPVASSAVAMADLAIALLRDPERRESLRRRLMAAARAHLYDRMDMVHSFEDFVTDAIAQARRARHR